MSRKDDILNYRGFFETDPTVIYSKFYSRTGDPDIDASDRIKAREMPILNDLRDAVQRRMGAVGISRLQFSVIRGGEKDETLTGQLNDWLKQQCFGANKKFLTFAKQVLERLEVDGEAPLKLILKNGIPFVRLLDDANFSIETNPKNIYEIEKYATEETRDLDDAEALSQESSQVTIREEIDNFTYSTYYDGIKNDEESFEHNFGFIPVVLLKRKEILGSPHGESGLAELIEPQIQIIRTSLNIARANKYSGFGVFAAMESGNPNPENFSIKPGSFLPYPVSRIDGGGASAALFQELETWRDALFAQAGVRRATQSEIADTPDLSGKALLILNADGMRQIADIQEIIFEGFSEMARKALAMAGVANYQEIFVEVSLCEEQKIDPAAVQAKAQILFSEGYRREALRILGYDEQQINSMELERENGAFDFEESPF